MTFRLVCLFVIAAALTVWPACSRSDPVALQTKWVEGNVLRHRMTIESRTKLEGEQPEDTVSKTRQVLKTTVEHVAADGAVTLSTTIESVRIEKETSSGRSVYDSESDPTPTALALRMQAALIGVTVRMSIAPDGRVLTTDGGDEIQRRLAAILGEQPDAGGMVAQIGSLFDPKQISTMWPPQNKHLPSKPVRVGDTWEIQETIQVPMLGEMKTTGTFRVASIEGPAGKENVRITSNGRIKHATPDPAGPLASVASTEFGNTDSKGEMDFSVERGQLTRSRRDLTSTMNMKTGTPPNEHVLKTATATTMTFELLPGPSPTAAGDK